MINVISSSFDDFDHLKNKSEKTSNQVVNEVQTP
jgi:hypothetical protein